MKTKSIITFPKNVGSKVLAPRHLSSWLASNLDYVHPRAEVNSAPTIYSLLLLYALADFSHPANP
jgi:hypothetical protein